MNHSLKRILSLVLVLAMAFAMVPAEAAALEISDSHLHTAQTEIILNPLYEGLVEEAQILAAHPKVPDAELFSTSETEYVDEARAVELLRSAMVDRLDTVVIPIATEDTDHNTQMKRIFQTALNHTGVPTEGDYLTWHYGSWKASSKYYEDGTTRYYTTTFTLTYYTTAGQEAQMDSAVEALLETLALDSGTDYEKVKGVYDYICANVTYDYDNLEDKTYTLKHAAYAALINGTAVCQGYASLLYRLALELGVDCRVVAGLGGTEAHGWNILGLEGLYYNADSTWDAGDSTYTYFLVSEENFPNHIRGNYSDSNGIDYTAESFYEAYPMGAENYVYSEPETVAGGSCGEDLAWTLDNRGKLTVTGTGAMTDFTSTGQPWRDNKQDITSVEIGEGVTSVGSYAFFHCYSLKNVTLADSVVNIGSSAFFYCSALPSVDLPENLETIGDHAFGSCHDLTDAQFPANLKSIGVTAFSGTELGSAVLPEGIESIGTQAFLGCPLKVAQIPASLESIGFCAFQDCGPLDYIFVDENNPVYCNDSQGALYTKDMENLIVVPAGFSGEFEIPDSVWKITGCAMRNCDLLTAVTIPESVTEIGDLAFYDSAVLDNVVWPDSVTVVPRSAFSGCTGLSSIELPEGVTVLDQSAFYKCTSLEELTVPASVTEIGSLCFGNSGLKTVTFLGDPPVFTNANAFSGVTAEARYPSSNENWTEEVKQQYSGTVTWTAVCMDEEHPYEAVVTEPGCTEEGYTTYTCPICGDSYEDDYTDALGHDYVEGVCTRCGEADPDYVVYSGTCGENVTWQLDGATGHLTIFGTGAMTDFERAKAPWYEYCAQITSASISEGITNVGNYSFYNCEEMTGVTLPDSILRIGEGAFQYCESMDGVRIPQGVTHIGRLAFRWCLGLTEIHIPDSVTAIDDSAFSGCSGLRNVAIPDSVTSLGPSAFEGCKYLTGVTLPRYITQIPDSLFSNCWFLDDVVIPEGVTRIGMFAFFNCYSMDSISVPDTVTEIDGGAFADCSALTSFVIPEGVTVIRDGTFSGCRGLTSVTIPAGVTVIEEEAFYECSSLTDIAIPAAVTTIGLEAFMGTGLRSVVLPDSVTSLGEYAFKGCGNLTEVSLSNNLTAILKETFTGTAIKELTIPASVTTIEGFAFWNAEELSKMVFRGDAPMFGTSQTGYDVFLNLTLTAYYPPDNDTWTPEVMQQYGGTVTWVCGDGKAPEAPAEDLNWHFENGVLTISGNGGMGDYTQNTMPWAAHKEDTVTIVIEEGITSVGSWAFCQFSNVTSVSIPSTVGRIGSYSFYNAASLSSINIPESITSIEDYAFHNCNSLPQTVVLPGSVQTIGKYAFSSCASLTNLRAEAGLFAIGEGAFSSCPSLTLVSLPATVQQIGLFAFGDCGSLEQIGVDDANPNYYSRDGVLFTEGAGVLIQYPAGMGGIYNVPQQVVRVENHAFRGCGSLQWVVFPGDAPTFGEYAFYNTETTVRYPFGNGTWTDDVMQDYGGTLTWMAVDTREPQEAQTINGDFTYHSHATEQNASYTFSYDDSWFCGSATKYNHDLARMSIRLATCAADTESENIEALMESLGMSALVIHYPAPTLDTVGYAIGSKRFIGSDGEPVTLITVAVRGGGYGAEWGNNFLVGAGGDHQGFSGKADQLTAAVKDYILRIGADENARIWITGFSRAAAISNLTARKLNEASLSGELLGIAPNDIFAYCFACPQGTVTPASDGNIHSILAGNDLVPMVAPSGWGFGRNGNTLYLPTHATAYNDFFREYYAMRSEYIALLKQAYLDEQLAQTGSTDESKAIVTSSAEGLKLTSFFEEHDMAISKIVGTVSDVMGRQDYVPDIQSVVVSLLGSASASDSFTVGDAIKVFFECKKVSDYFDDPLTFAMEEVKGYLMPGPLESMGFAHYYEFYLAWLDSIDGSQLSSENRTRAVTANCPVDISVYDSAGILVAQILSNEVQTVENSTILAYVDADGQKTVLLPYDEEFRIEVTATGSGTMSYRIEEIDLTEAETTRVVNYYDVAISEGDVLNGTAGAGVDTEAQYSLTDPEGETLTPSNDLTGEEIAQYAVNVSAEGSGSVSGGGRYTVGEYALVTARPEEGASFEGWYMEGKPVSAEAEYRFRVEADVQLAAKFTQAAPSVVRLSGKDRYLTAFAVADQLKELMAVEQFDAVVVAYGQNFPDALTGSYLAAVKNAPILLTEARADDRVLDYIRSNLKAGGKVYILGGTAAVSQYFEDEANSAGFDVQRLKDKNRYGTNLAILREAGIKEDDEILIATGKNYADSLSASATGLPMLLVDKTLNADQIEFLKGTSGKFVIIGGTGAVSQEIEDQLNEIGTAERVKGKTRYETSVVIAERYFSNPKAAVLAYAQGFPDGLCGGPLAVLMGAPLILTSNEAPAAADAYIEGITAGAVTGGTGRISDDTVREIFDLDADVEIPKM